MMRTLFRLQLLILIAVASAACSVAPYRYDNSPQQAVEQRAQRQDAGAFSVRASVPGKEEAKELFGIPLHRRGIQAVWLEITNSGDVRARFAPYSLDDEYFPPLEVAYMHRKRFSKQGLADMESYLYSITMPRVIPPGKTVSGYVFTHETIGTKAFNVDIHYAGGAGDNEDFTFFIDVPGFVPDHATVDFRALYAPEEVQRLDNAGFRNWLENWTCCTSNHDGSARGQPVKLFLVATPSDLLQALLRAEWSETSYERTNNLLFNMDYIFGRPPDTIFKKGRGRGTERNEIALWLTPVLVDGVPVWAVQAKHAIGRLFEFGELFLGAQLDPDADEGRNFLMQNLWYSQTVTQFAWSYSGIEVDRDSPARDFNGHIWFSDGFRLVLWLSGEPVSLTKAGDLGWDSILSRVGESRP
jgi:hypothetical protein